MAGYFVNEGDTPLRYFDKVSYERIFKVKVFSDLVLETFFRGFM